MRHAATMGLITLLLAGCSAAAESPSNPPADPSAVGTESQEPAKPAADEPVPPKAPKLGEGWVSLFDGKDLDGWKAAESPATFAVRDGMIVVNGPRGHLFYTGDVAKHDFKDFEFRCDVMTTPGSNSGVFIHTRYQDTDWPKQGYEVQVNQTHADPQKTAGLYDVDKVLKTPAEDGKWFTLEIIVRGKRIITKVDGKTQVDYTEPETPERSADRTGRVLSSGTFALQGHDPKSKVYFANIMVKPLSE